jgi:hypothetical protein
MTPLGVLLCIVMAITIIYLIFRKPPPPNGSPEVYNEKDTP